MNRVRRLFALLMTLAMVLTYIPSAAYASVYQGDDSRHAVSLEYVGSPLHYDSDAENQEDANDSLYDSLYAEGNAFVVHFSDNSSETYKYNKIEEEGFSSENFCLDGDFDNGFVPEWTVNTASGKITFNLDAGYYSEEKETLVENILTTVVSATPYPYPVKVEYDGPELTYKAWDEDKDVDLCQEGAKFIITYSDGSPETWICRNYEFIHEGICNTGGYDYFLNGEDPVIEKDEEGNEFASNALSFDYNGTDKDVTVSVYEYVRGQNYTLTTKIPKVADPVSIYQGFVYESKYGYGHEMFDDDEAYSFYVPCEAYAETKRVDFTEEDLSKVKITVTTPDDKSYSPKVTTDKNVPGCRLYTFDVPPMKWGDKFEIHYDYNNGRIIDEIECTVKKWLDLDYTIKDRTYDGDYQEPSVTVKYGKNILDKGTDFELSYDPGARLRNVGIYNVYVSSPEDSKYAAYAELTFKILPEGTTVSKVTKGKKSFTVSWKKQTDQTTGYEIQYGLKKNFKGAKIVTVSKNTKTKTTVKKLKAKKTYYVRVRTYKTVKGKKICSNWSPAKTVKTR